MQPPRTTAAIDNILGLAVVAAGGGADCRVLDGTLGRIFDNNFFVIQDDILYQQAPSLPFPSSTAQPCG
jgi:hypothetical protein